MIRDGITAEGLETDAFLMIGQSNMSGRGDIGSVPPIENPNCFMLRCGRWQIMGEPVNPDRGPAAEFQPGVCLASSFADAYQKRTGRRTGLIPCADGGTTIAQWEPGGVLFDHAVFQTLLAARNADIKGILWHQGESDCKDGKDYVERFSVMIQEMRRQLGDENLPVILGELSGEIPKDKRRGITDEQIEKMNGNFRRIVREVPYCALASAEGLTLRQDGIHFDGPSLRTFGLRYFDAYITHFA
ncbi:MAG: sialate O-acetylesterase [Ruminococcaceae bacterium]|nr:sialate O-acetylesterase [Oscillospiraceae bacterium]